MIGCQPRCHGTGDGSQHRVEEQNPSLGAQYSRLRTRFDAPKAITAMAHKLARVVYRRLRYRQQ